MSSIIDPIIANVLAVQIKLYACRARLEDETDPEALHDLRTNVRRLRTLLRPLRELPGVTAVEQSAKALGQLTTPLRDREVLAAHLAEAGLTAPAQRRVAAMRGVYGQVARSAPLGDLLSALDRLPGFLRAAQRQKLTQGLRKHIRKRLARQWKKLSDALQDPAHDRHELRLLVKRVRYGVEAYPQLETLSDRGYQHLKKAQGALGDWHDNWQWLLQAEQEDDLQPCVRQWTQALHDAEKKADRVVERMAANVLKKGSAQR